MSEPGTRVGPPRRRSRWWIYLLLLVAVGLAVRFVAWPRAEAWWAATFPDSAPATVAAADPLTSRIETLETRLERDRAATDSVLDGLRGSLSQVQRQVSASTTGESRLAEIEHLVAAARQRAELDLDHRTALRLLAAADTLMLESGDPRYGPVRLAIATDVAAIQAQLAVDIDGTYARLSRLSQSVTTLPLRQAEYRAEPAATPSAADDWWSRVTESLGGLVRVRTADAATDAPLLAREAQAIVQQRIGLALDHAATALLRGDSDQLSAALARADALVQQHADPRAATVVEMRQILAAVRASPPVRRAVPIGALAALAELPRPTPPGLLPPPESFGGAAAQPLEDVPRTLPALPAVPGAVPPSGRSSGSSAPGSSAPGPRPAIRPDGTGISL